MRLSNTAYKHNQYEDSENVLSASARNLQSLNKMNIMTDVDDIEESTSAVDKNLPSYHFLVDSDILKSIVTITGACPKCKNQLQIKTDMLQKKGLMKEGVIQVYQHCVVL